MCRIISFISSAGGIGKTSIIYELSKDLSSSKNKVCVFDGYFGINNLSLKYENDEDIDLKDYTVETRKDYTNKFTNAVTNTSLTINKYLKKSIESVFGLLNKMIEE